MKMFYYNEDLDEIDFLILSQEDQDKLDYIEKVFDQVKDKNYSTMLEAAESLEKEHKIMKIFTEDESQGFIGLWLTLGEERQETYFSLDNKDHTNPKYYFDKEAWTASLKNSSLDDVIGKKSTNPEVWNEAMKRYNKKIEETSKAEIKSQNNFTKK